MRVKQFLDYLSIDGFGLSLDFLSGLNRTLYLKRGDWKRRGLKRFGQNHSFFFGTFNNEYDIHIVFSPPVRQPCSCHVVPKTLFVPEFIADVISTATSSALRKCDPLKMVASHFVPDSVPGNLNPNRKGPQNPLIRMINPILYLWTLCSPSRKNLKLRLVVSILRSRIIALTWRLATSVNTLTHILLPRGLGKI